MSDTPYHQLGGEQAVRRLVDRFYDLMETLPEAQTIRAMHPEDLGSSREKLFLFLSGWLGGPALYVQRYGHPRLRMRHLPFPIGEDERDAWLLCMETAIVEQVDDDALAAMLMRGFTRTADHMRNEDDGPPRGGGGRGTGGGGGRGRGRFR